MDSDVIVRGVTGNGEIKITAASCRCMVGRAVEIHGLTPVTAAALGRTLIAASMLGNELKNESNSLTIQIKGNGPIGKIVAVSDYIGNTRGYCQRPGVELPLRHDNKLDVSGAVGNKGYLSVIKDVGLKEPYIGQIELRSGEIAEDITAYLAESEQVPSACALGVLVDTDYSIKSAGGFIIQLLPNASDDTIEKLEKAIEHAPHVTELLCENHDPRNMMRKVISGFDIKFLKETEVGYRCFCSRERVERTILSLGRKDIDEIINEDKGAEITCQFCDEVYNFTTEDIKSLLAKGSN